MSVDHIRNFVLLSIFVFFIGLGSLGANVKDIESETETNAEIIKVYNEVMPASRFIGKKYLNEDRDNSGFANKWGEWHFERYNCPRFTDPDEDGKVILDYGFFIK